MDVDIKVLKPRQPVPELEVDTLQGPWSLSEQTPDIKARGRCLSRRLIILLCWFFTVVCTVHFAQSI